MLSQLSLISLPSIRSRAALEGPIGPRVSSVPARRRTGSVGVVFAAKPSAAPAVFTLRLPNFRARTRAFLDQLSMGREITGQHVALDSVPMSFLPLLVPLASLACSTPFSAKPSGGVMACQMIFAWIFAAIVAATAGPCTRRGLSWLRGVLNLFPRALMCLPGANVSAHVSAQTCGVQS